MGTPEFNDRLHQPGDINFTGIDPELSAWIQDLTGDVSAQKYSGSFYTCRDAERRSNCTVITKDSLLTLARHFKSFVPELPDQILLIAASWFLTHLNLISDDPRYEKLFQKSILVYTYSPAVVSALKKLYWTLRDHYYPNQSCGEGGLTRYDSFYDLMGSTDGWKKLHVISLTHLTDDMFSNLITSIGRQNNSLFFERWPVIVVADPSQPRPKNKGAIFSLEI